MARKQERMHNAKRARAERAKSEVSLYEVPDDLDLADSSWGRNTRILCFGEELSELLGGGEVSVSFAGPG
ncbi:hypothetical protein MZK47_16420, partial [Microbacterium aerolatum]|uniref:hypothetical protein n=1 Tax=Microbacterium aerolatum TaxID=153731 RepID=UPI0020005E45